MGSLREGMAKTENNKRRLCRQTSDKGTFNKITNYRPRPCAGDISRQGVFMFQPVSRGDDYSYFHEKETDQYLLYRQVSNIQVILEDEDARNFQEYIEMINSDPLPNKKERTEKTIRIYFSFFNFEPLKHIIDA